MDRAGTGTVATSDAIDDFEDRGGAGPAGSAVGEPWWRTDGDVGNGVPYPGETVVAIAQDLREGRVETIAFSDTAISTDELVALVPPGPRSETTPRAKLGNAVATGCLERMPQRRGHHFKEADMPAKSAAQQKAAGAALAAKRGDVKKSELKGASKSMEKSMTESQLDELASTKRKGKPEHSSKS